MEPNYIFPVDFVGKIVGMELYKYVLGQYSFIWSGIGNKHIVIKDELEKYCMLCGFGIIIPWIGNTFVICTARGIASKLAVCFLGISYKYSEMHRKKH